MAEILTQDQQIACPVSYTLNHNTASCFQIDLPNFDVPIRKKKESNPWPLNKYSSSSITWPYNIQLFLVQGGIRGDIWLSGKK